MKKKSILLMLIIFVIIFAFYINSSIYAFSEVEDVTGLSDSELEEEIKNMITELTHSRCNGSR